MAEKGQIYAYLAAVGDYHGTGCCDLPTWKRDQELIYEGLTRGLHLMPDNIRIGGKDGYLSTAQFASAMADYRDKSCEEDTLLIYFSCHGGEGALVLSDGKLLLQSVVDYTASLNTGSKLVILDCCYAGGAITGGSRKMLPDESIEQFAGRGIAVMASTAVGETARMGLPPDHSLYTAALSTAMMTRRLIRNGRITLHDLNAETCFLVNKWSKHHPDRKQTPIFRSNIGGTIVFPITECRIDRKPYTKQQREGYIICDEKPLNTARYKRKAFFILIDTDQREEYLRITREIAIENKGQHVIWCYFGHDAGDMIRHVFDAYTIWAADEENRAIHFRRDENTEISEDICLVNNTAYLMVRELQQSDITSEEYLGIAHKLQADMISRAESLISMIQEIENHTMTLGELRTAGENDIKQIKYIYYQLSELPPSPDECHKEDEKIQELAGWILDIVIWTETACREDEYEERSRWLIWEAIRKYRQEITD